MCYQHLLSKTLHYYQPLNLQVILAKAEIKLYLNNEQHWVVLDYNLYKQPVRRDKGRFQEGHITWNITYGYFKLEAIFGEFVRQWGWVAKNLGHLFYVRVWFFPSDYTISLSLSTYMHSYKCKISSEVPQAKMYKHLEWLRLSSVLYFVSQWNIIAKIPELLQSSAPIFSGRITFKCFQELYLLSDFPGLMIYLFWFSWNGSSCTD